MGLLILNEFKTKTIDRCIEIDYNNINAMKRKSIGMQ